MSYTPPTGVVAASWVGAAAYKGPVRVLFGRWAGGTYITPAGNNELAFGTPFVTKQQFASPLGVDCLSFAPALVARGTDYIPPFRDLDARWVGAAEYEPPAMPLNVAWTSGPKESQYVFVEPISALGMGEPAAIWPQTIAPVGVDGSVVGAPVVRPPPVNASWYGAPEYTPSVLDLWARWGVVLEGYIYMRGWQSGAVGIGLSLRNHNTRIDGAGGVPPATAFGDHSVWLFTRRLSPAGTDQQQYGTQWASHWLRYLTAVGAGDKTSRGTPWVSHNPRYLEPGGLDALKFFESHQVGGTRWLGPEGFDPLAFGERIIPEETTLYPSSILGAVGNHDVQLLKRYLGGKGFLTNPDDLRFGRADLWNLRQIVQQDYDPNDGLNPPPFGQWTGIENRNKEPVPVGWLSERHGYQFIWNKASLVTPSGIEAPLTGAGSVTHWRRTVAPGGIDSLASERWHAAYNTADVLRAQGALHQDFGQHALENRSRLYDKVGNFDSMAMGTPMVSDAIRTLAFEPRYSIEPPNIELPRVDLYTRYIEGISAGDRMGAGSPALDIRWTIISPKWSFHPPALIGEPALHNVTPELRTGGMNHEEFGDTAIRTQWRRVETKDGDMTRWGRPIVRDRRHWVEFVTVGAPPNLMPGPVVTKVGGLPDQQSILPAGINMHYAGWQVARPELSFMSAMPKGIDALEVGKTVVTANSIRVEPGYWDLLFGKPAVSLKSRVLTVAPFPPGHVFDPPPVRVSPHTIYAVVEASKQAQDNHKAIGLHYVDHDSTGRSKKGPGTPSISLRRGVVVTRSIFWPTSESLWIGPVVANTLRFIAPQGWHSLRYGIHTVPGAHEVAVANAFDGMSVGIASIARVEPPGPRVLAVAGCAPPPIQRPVVEFLHRGVSAVGWVSARMGYSVAGDNPYQWQGLRIGPLMPTIPEGFAAESLGEPWVSLRVRDMPVQGWDSFECGYDISQFDKRMRVTRTPTPRPPTQGISPLGMPATDIPAPDLRAGRHYIRPDGNAEQYRKGAPQ